jgi:hypothetical protein
MILAAIVVLSLVATGVFASTRRRRQKVSDAAARRISSNRRMSHLLNGVVALPRRHPVHESYTQFRERKQ